MKYFVKIAANPIVIGGKVRKGLIGADKIMDVFTRGASKGGNIAMSARETLVLNRYLEREAARVGTARSGFSISNKAGGKSLEKVRQQSSGYIKGKNLDQGKRSETLRNLKSLEAKKGFGAEAPQDFKIKSNLAHKITKNVGLVSAPYTPPPAPGFERLVRREGKKVVEPIKNLANAPGMQHIKNKAEYYSTAYKSLKNNPLAQDTAAIGIGAAKGIGRGAKAMHNFNMKALKTTAIAGGGLYAFNRLTD